LVSSAMLYAPEKSESMQRFTLSSGKKAAERKGGGMMKGWSRFPPDLPRME
jgi:hypothetical protein